MEQLSIFCALCCLLDALLCGQLHRNLPFIPTDPSLFELKLSQAHKLSFKEKELSWAAAFWLEMTSSLEKCKQKPESSHSNIARQVFF